MSGEHPPLEERAGAVDPEPWLELLEVRFGIGREHLAEHRLVRSSARVLALVRRDLEPPAELEPIAAGLPFLHPRSRPPKLTTVAALRFGRFATRNVVALESAQVAPFFERREIEVAAEQGRKVTGPGHVVVLFERIVLGVGDLVESAEGWRLHPLVPKSWEGIERAPAPLPTPG